MSNLKQFETSIVEFETEINGLKNVNKIFQEIKDIANVHENIVLKLNNSKNTITKLLSDFQDFENQIKLNISKLSNQQKKDIETIQVQISEKITELKDAQNKFKRELFEIIETLRNDNKRFYRDLEDTIRIKLTENKTEIKQLIDNEHDKLNKLVTEENIKIIEIINKQSKKQIIIQLVFFAILIGLSVVTLLQLFK